MAGRLRTFEDARVFLDEVGPFLERLEAENNLLLGIADTLITVPDRYDRPLLAVLETDGGIAGAALQTPPHNLVLARCGPEAARCQAECLRALGIALPGVSGMVGEARAFAERWTAGAGSFERRMAQRIYRLERVQPVAPAPGAMRRATAGDRGLLASWLAAFGDEAFDAPTDPEDHARTIEMRLAGGDRGLHLWEVDGEPVSLAGYGGRTPNGIRIGPVYTPPALRGRGYASALVAALSEELLAGGKRFCFLFTDLANPTSNSIYRRIGYEPVCDAEVLRFVS